MGDFNPARIQVILHDTACCGITPQVTDRAELANASTARGSLEVVQAKIEDRE